MLQIFPEFSEIVLIFFNSSSDSMNQAVNYIFVILYEAKSWIPWNKREDHSEIIRNVIFEICQKKIYIIRQNNGLLKSITTVQPTVMITVEIHSPVINWKKRLHLLRWNQSKTGVATKRIQYYFIYFCFLFFKQRTINEPSLSICSLEIDSTFHTWEVENL